MISRLRELEEIKNRYYEAKYHATKAYGEKAKEIANDNFWWVLQAAISATKACETREGGK